MTTPRIVVSVAYAAPGVESHDTVTLNEGATVGDAVAASGVIARLNLDAALLQYAIFGQRARADSPLAHGDRVELTRPLVTDPKGGRRKRAAAKSPGRAGGSKGRARR
jgi:uncharacterized protein